MRSIVTWLMVMVLALVLGVSSSFAAQGGDSKTSVKKPTTKHLDATSKHILDLKNADPKIRASAAKDLGCS